MFAKSKKFVIPLVSLLAACMAVDAAPTGDVSLPESCTCTVPSDLANDTRFYSQGACTSVGQVNGAVWDEVNHHCDLGTLSGYNSFLDFCSKYSSASSGGSLHYGVPGCVANFPHVPVPQSCACTDPSGVNTAAQTLKACTFFNNIGTMVGDKCVLASDDQYFAFGQLCTKLLYPGSTQTCSAQ